MRSAALAAESNDQFQIIFILIGLIYLCNLSVQVSFILLNLNKLSELRTRYINDRVLAKIGVALTLKGK